MTEPQRDRFDDELRAFLATEARAIDGAPSVSEMAARISANVGTRGLALRPAPMLAWALLAALLAIALVGIALIGVGGRRDGLAVDVESVPSVRSHEAVFLRVDPDGDVVVVAVGGTALRQREVLRLPGGRPGDGRLAGDPVGAVARSGLLAVPRPIQGQFRWEIVDLRAPAADPIVVPGIQQDVEPFLRSRPYVVPDARGGVFWGPRDRLAIVWYEHIPLPDVTNGFGLDVYVTFVDGRTGEAQTVDLPEEELIVLPYWAADGSGVLVGSSSPDRPLASGVLRPDGTVVDGVPPQVTSFCLDPDPSAPLVDPQTPLDGFECDSPDRRMTYRWPDTLTPDEAPSFQVDGAWAGWMEVES